MLTRLLCTYAPSKFVLLSLFLLLHARVESHGSMWWGGSYEGAEEGPRARKARHSINPKGIRRNSDGGGGSGGSTSGRNTRNAASTTSNTRAPSLAIKTLHKFHQQETQESLINMFIYTKCQSRIESSLCIHSLVHRTFCVSCRCDIYIHTWQPN